MKGFGKSQNPKKPVIRQKTNLTPEELISEAFKFHSQGNISKASKYYQLFIDKGFIDPMVFSNYGAIQKQIGQTEKAVKLYKRAIQVNPSYAEAHSNLGNILRDLGKPEEAEVSTRKAIELKPSFANAYSNLGNILYDRGKQKEAFDSYVKAIELDPNIFDNYSSLTELLGDSNPSQFNKSNLENILKLLLERDDIPHNKLFRAFNYLYGNELVINLNKINTIFDKVESIKLFINEKLLINALAKIIFTDSKLEESLTKLRASICNQISKNIGGINYFQLNFIIALGEQCFLNEYAYSLSKEENISVHNIINKCRVGELNEIYISILSCYFPLYKLLDQLPLLKSFNSSNENFKGLIKLQVSEPLEEIRHSQRIKKLGPINDEISQKVKSQYEENPYPRWRYGGKRLKNQRRTLAQIINKEIKPNFINQNIDYGQLNILVAGCGTGQHILYAQNYKNAQITAIDLSLSSLSYAQRKINELGINNVELIQMDILQVNLLEKKFDIIESGGVLHHMDNPLKGLKALLGVLNDNGFLKLGLYSELARKNIVKAREFIIKHNIEPIDENIRDFRETIFSGRVPDLNSIAESPDFYTLSSCRDLCFHAKEHRFTINQLKATLESNQLNFLGFLLPEQVKSRYKNYFPEDKTQINLQNWAKFEEEYPNTFLGMYQFWVSKEDKKDDAKELNSVLVL